MDELWNHLEELNGTFNKGEDYVICFSHNTRYCVINIHIC